MSVGREKLFDIYIRNKICHTNEDLEENVVILFICVICVRVCVCMCVCVCVCSPVKWKL